MPGPDPHFKICPECHTVYSGAARFCPKDGRALESARKGTVRLYDPYIGTVQDNRLKMEAAISEDALSVVYAARHLVLDRRVTVKVLRSEYSEDKVMVERFLSQARQSAKLDHPNLAQILDSGRFEDGSPFFVAEFLGTRTLRAVMDQTGPLPWPKALALATQACAGLEHAHRAGVVHGNLNPEDLVLVREDPKENWIKVSGFGISEISVMSRHETKTGFLVGVPEYMSPEQAAGRPTGPWTDIYSLSVILFEMVTGRVPFESDSFMGALGKHMVEPVPDPRVLCPELELPDGLVSILMRGLAKKPRDRFESMSDMGSALAAQAGAPSVLPLHGPSVGVEDLDDRAPTRVYEVASRNGGADDGSFSENPGAWDETSDARWRPGGVETHRRTSGTHQDGGAAGPESMGGLESSRHHSGQAKDRGIPWTKRMVSLEQVVWAAVALAVGLVLGLGLIWLSRRRPVTGRNRTNPPVQSTQSRKVTGGSPTTSAGSREGPQPDPFINLVVETAPPGAEVELDGELLGVTPLRIRVRRAPGAHLLTARLAGFSVYRTRVSLAEALQLRIQLDEPARQARKKNSPGRRRRTRVRPVYDPGPATGKLAAPSSSHDGSGKTRKHGELLDPFKL